MALYRFTNISERLLLNNRYNKLMLYSKNVHMCKKVYQQVFMINKLMYNVCFIRKANTNNFISFDNYIQQKRAEAERTAIFLLESKKLLPKLINYCLQYGNIKTVHYYSNSYNKHHALLEFESQNGFAKLHKDANYIDSNYSFTTPSQFFWFRNSINVMSSVHKNSKAFHLHSIKNCDIFTESDIVNKLNNIDSISNQMLILYECLRLNDTEIRLRFVTANQLEKSFSCLFHNMKVLPFGSSINGFGKQGCDLDLVMCCDISNETDRSRIIYCAKTTNDERQKTTLGMESLSKCMRNLIPGIKHVREILKARVPIIKYTHIITGLECDLTMSNMTGIYMSELLYLYGEIDVRTRPLIFTIRKWAYDATLTRSDPGPWITNFSLTLLVIYFLQIKNILPTLNYMKYLAEANDVRQADNHVDCTFLRNISKLPMQNKNTQNLESLLIDFFRFYSEFDFGNKAISIKEGKQVRKLDSSPLYICNPLEISLNVSKNVTSKEVHRFTSFCAHSVETLNQSPDKKCKQHGLLNIFNPRNVALVETKSITSKLNIQNLFNEENCNDKIHMAGGKVKT